MVEWNEHEIWLLERLGHLQEWKRVAFAAACAQRALPVYLAYVEHLDDNRRPRTKVDQVNFALAFVWRNMTDINRNSDEAQGHINILEQIIVGMEEDPLPLVRFDSEALYAAYSINSSLHTYLSRNAEDAVRAAHSNYDILGSYFFETMSDRNRERSGTDIQDVHAHQREELLRFKNHPLVQAELNRQRHDVTRLDETNDTGSEAFITSFREESTNVAILPQDILHNSQ